MLLKARINVAASTAARPCGVIRLNTSKSLIARCALAGPKPAERASPVNNKLTNGMALPIRRAGAGTVATRAYSSAANNSSDSNYSLMPVLASVAVASAGAFAFGYHLGIVNGPLDAIARDLGFAFSKSMQGLVVSSTLLGAAIGSFTGGGFADALGRRKAFLLAALPMLLGPLLSATAGTYNAMVAGRFVTGLALGLSSALVPVYISEVSPTAIRGTLGSLNQLMICIGILVALLVNVAIPVTDWSTMFMIGAVPAVALFGGMLFSPESPVWLAGHGKRSEAEAVANKLWGPSGASQLPSSTGTGGKQAGWGDLFAPKYRKAVLIGCMLFLFQQFSGINALIYFSSSVFKQAGIQSGTLASAAVGATNVIGTLIATGLIEKAGRKQLLTQSYAGMAITMAVMAAGFGLPALAAYSGTVALVGTLLYILSFAIGAGPVSGLIVPELNNASVRGNAVSAAMVTHWICNVAVGQNFMTAVDSYGISAVYGFFALCSTVGVLYIRSNVPETKGKSFEQIQSELAA